MCYTIKAVQQLVLCTDRCLQRSEANVYLRTQNDGDEVALWRTCSLCRGQEVQNRAHCDVCGEVVPEREPWWEGADELPCGHAAGVYFREHVCSDCEGKGRVLKPVSGEEYAAWRQRQYVRGAFLLLLGLVPVAAIVAAVSGAEPDLVCGSWWYGAAFLLGLDIAV